MRIWMKGSPNKTNLLRYSQTGLAGLNVTPFAVSSAADGSSVVVQNPAADVEGLAGADLDGAGAGKGCRRARLANGQITVGQNDRAAVKMRGQSFVDDEGGGHVERALVVQLCAQCATGVAAAGQDINLGPGRIDQRAGVDDETGGLGVDHAGQFDEPVVGKALRHGQLSAADAAVTQHSQRRCGLVVEGCAQVVAKSPKHQ
jgi:hypothetical protein